ncbi:zinc finger protein 878 [Ceratitis capitata]|uniref:zinc finger protein 878 n=1 Tax=Ceratitis capitata TaxID=7213 RepID=UPI000329D8F5|nr:zinc finger protein 878 [Ceratitis capitata]
MDQVAHVEACRLCANFYVAGGEVEFVHIFEPLDGLEEQMEFLRTQTVVWQLQIVSNDGLPQRICANCFAQFCNIYTFRQQCVLAQQKLLQSFVGVGLDSENVATAPELKQTIVLSQQASGGVSGGHADLSNDNELLNSLKIDAPVTSAELMASLDCLQPPATTSADVIASLDGLQLPASVAETLSMLTQELTTIQNGSVLDNSTSSITTHAIMDTKTEQTNVLQLGAASSTQNNYFSQQSPITTVSAGTNTPVTLVKNSGKTITAVIPPKRSKAADIDLEDMLQGSIIHKNSQGHVAENTSTKEKTVRAAKRRVSTYADTLEDDVSLFSCSDQDESNEIDDVENDADPASQTRISRNPFACQYCYCPNSGSIDHLVFDSSDSLSQHFFDIHDPNLPYTCPYCPQKYSSVRQRDYHVRLIHPTASKAEQCDYCKKTLRSPKELHEFSCQFLGDWRCETCEQRFFQVPLSRFRTHQRNHTTSKFKCRECDREFVRRANLEAHERMHRPRANYRKQCDQCQEVFMSDYELRRHKYQAHNGELPVRCEYCHKGFVSLAFLSRHSQHFHPDKVGHTIFAGATCNNCGCAFSSQNKLRIHLQRPRDENGRCLETIHEVIPPTDRARQLRRQRLHSCSHCNKRFSTRATLEKHMSTHNMSSFACTECATVFQNGNELKRHIMLVHIKPRFLKCDQCDKRFCYMRELQQHQKDHAEEGEVQDKTLLCPIAKCRFVASCKQEATDHALNKHKLVSCEYCNSSFSRNRLWAHMRSMHAVEIGAGEPNNNNNSDKNNATLSSDSQETETEESLAVASILNDDTVQLNNNDIMVSFEEGAANGGEKVRVELVNQQPTNISGLVLQEQTTDNTYKELIPTSDEIDENFLMNNLLDPDHEIIVT